MQSVTYTNEAADFAAYFGHHYDHSQSMRAWAREEQLRSVSMILIVFAALSLMFGMPVLLLVGGLAAFLSVRRNHGSARDEYIKHRLLQHNEGGSQSMRHWHRLTVTREAILDRTSDSEATIKWRAVHTITETEDFFFITTTVVPVWIVPKHRLSQGDLEAFREQLERFEQEARRS